MRRLLDGPTEEKWTRGTTKGATGLMRHVHFHAALYGLIFDTALARRESRAISRSYRA